MKIQRMIHAELWHLFMNQRYDFATEFKSGSIIHFFAFFPKF